MAGDHVGKIKTIGQLYMFTLSGIVHEAQSRTKMSTTTRTSVSGGGGQFYGGVGRIDPVNATTEVVSSSAEMIRLFVVEEGGKEFDFELPAPGFGIRGGHSVSVVCAGDQATRRGHPMALVNHNTGNQKVFADRAGWIVGAPNPALMIALVLVLPFLVMLAATLITGTGGLKPALVGLMVAVGVILWLFARRSALVGAVVGRVTEEARSKAAAAG